MNHDKPTRNAIRVLALLLALAFVPVAQAGTTIPVTSFSPALQVMASGGAAWQLLPGFVPSSAGTRALTVGAGGVFTAVDAVPVIGRAGSLAVVATETMALSDVALAVGKCVIGANALCAVGTAAYLGYHAYRAIPPAGVPGSVVSSASLDFDPGMSANTQPAYLCIIDGNSAYSGTETAFAAACADAAAVASMNSSATGSTRYVYTINTCTVSTNCQYTIDWFSKSTGLSTGHYPGHVASVGTGTISNCLASIDALNSAYNIPAGSPVGPDGKCPTARYNHIAKTAADIATIIAANPSGVTGNQVIWKQAVTDSLSSGQSIPSTVITSGPASQTGTSSSSSSVTGGVTTTTVNTPTYNYNYAGDTVSYTTTNVQTINNGTTTTTTTSTPAPATALDPTDPCTANPDRVGCSKYGTPVPGTMPTSSIPVSITPVAFASGGGCPPDLAMPFSIMGHSFNPSISYASACSAASNILAPIFLLLSVAAAAYIFVGGLKS